jgi:hypothetical protein
LTGSYAAAAGALATGILAQSLTGHGFSEIQSYRTILLGYAAASMVLIVLFSRLSSASEVMPAASEQAQPKAIFGLHRSRSVILKLSALFALDAFAGGFVLQSVIAYWFQLRFGAEPATLGSILFGANLLAGLSALAAAALARRIGLVPTMVFTHVPSTCCSLYCRSRRPFLLQSWCSSYDIRFRRWMCRRGSRTLRPSLRPMSVRLRQASRVLPARQQ